jgi:hypothetical protein
MHSWRVGRLCRVLFDIDCIFYLQVTILSTKPGSTIVETGLVASTLDFDALSGAFNRFESSLQSEFGDATLDVDSISSVDHSPPEIAITSAGKW